MPKMSVKKTGVRLAPYTREIIRLRRSAGNASLRKSGSV
jgi:hypothetical protein